MSFINYKCCQLGILPQVRSCIGVALVNSSGMRKQEGSRTTTSSGMPRKSSQRATMRPLQTCPQRTIWSSMNQTIGEMTIIAPHRFDKARKRPGIKWKQTLLHDPSCGSHNEGIFFFWGHQLDLEVNEASPWRQREWWLLSKKKKNPVSRQSRIALHQHPENSAGSIVRSPFEWASSFPFLFLFFLFFFYYFILFYFIFIFIYFDFYFYFLIFDFIFIF